MTDVGREALPQETSDKSDDTTGPQTSGQSGASQSPSFPPDDTVATRRGGHEYYNYTYVQKLESGVKTIRTKLQVLLVKADKIQESITKEKDSLNKAGTTGVVKEFVNSCCPMFYRLESTARSTTSQHLPMQVRRKMLEFSNELCDKLEQLLLLCNSSNILSLEESDPESVSYFYMGCSQLGQLRFKCFRYCKLMPCLAWTNTGVYKRMRWNVDHLQDNQKILERWTEEEQVETIGETDYYFLCYEEAAIRQSSGSPGREEIGTWSIGQWVQTYPEPNTDDLLDWLLCEVPQGRYNRLQVVGEAEPSSSTATDCLQRLLTQQPSSSCATLEEEDKVILLI